MAADVAGGVDRVVTKMPRVCATRPLRGMAGHSSFSRRDRGAIGTHPASAGYRQRCGAGTGRQRSGPSGFQHRWRVSQTEAGVVIGGARNSAPAISGGGTAVDPLKLYKSVDGYKAIMEWYESLEEKIAVPFESLYVNTRFGRTHILATGPRARAPTVPDLRRGGCAPLWRRQLESLSPNFRVYALDIPGQPGRSDPNPPSFLNEDYFDWLLDVLDDLGIERAHFAGISAGAWDRHALRQPPPAADPQGGDAGPTGISGARLPVKIWLGRVAQKWKTRTSCRTT